MKSRVNPLVVILSLSSLVVFTNACSSSSQETQPTHSSEQPAATAPTASNNPHVNSNPSLNTDRTEEEIAYEQGDSSAGTSESDSAASGEVASTGNSNGSDSRSVPTVVAVATSVPTYVGPATSAPLDMPLDLGLRGIILQIQSERRILTPQFMSDNAAYQGDGLIQGTRVVPASHSMGSACRYLARLTGLTEGLVRVSRVVLQSLPDSAGPIAFYRDRSERFNQEILRWFQGYCTIGSVNYASQVFYTHQFEHFFGTRGYGSEPTDGIFTWLRDTYLGTVEHLPRDLPVADARARLNAALLGEGAAITAYTTAQSHFDRNSRDFSYANYKVGAATRIREILQGVLNGESSATPSATPTPAPTSTATATP